MQLEKMYYKSIKIKCIRTKKVYEDYLNQLRKLMRAAEKKYHTNQSLENKQNYTKTLVNYQKRYY